MMARNGGGRTRSAALPQEATMETAIGIALIVISAVEIAWIVRVVQANMRAG
jgi:hypothetical protein